MVTDILDEAGIKYRRSRFPSPPEETYAVYTDNVETDGADGLNLMDHHSVTVEVYEPAPDDAAEAAIEAAMDDYGLTWTKQDRYWLQDTQRYQVVYEFEHITKRRA